MRHKGGFTLMEAMASLLIVSIVMVTTMSILIDSRLRAKISQEELVAAQVADMLSNSFSAYMSNSNNYLSLSTFSSGETPFTKTACQIDFDVNFCEFLFAQIVGQTIYDESKVFIIVREPTSVTIPYILEINYHGTRTVKIEGFVYASQ